MPEYDYTLSVTAKDRATAEWLLRQVLDTVPSFKYGPPFKSRAVRAAHRASKPVNVLCVRDPDGANEYVSDGEINEFTIDIGGSWRDFSDFAACLREGEDDAVEYERGMLAEVAHLDADNPVRAGVESFFAEARS